MDPKSPAGDVDQGASCVEVMQSGAGAASPLLVADPPGGSGVCATWWPPPVLVGT